MPPLDPALRKSLEKKIVEARDASEDAAEAALEALAVHEKESYASLTEAERRLRRALRAKARQLGTDPERDLRPLVEECAYEQWHRMLFARFLAENGLLMHPDYEGVSVSLEECAELARDEGDPDAWATASRYASAMLPGIFRTDDPLLEVRLFPEGRRALERVISEIPPPAFTSDDGIGWVYQFWQTKAKKEVNESGRKIGGHDLPAVTQLFTEDYMVKFLLHNTLGAWWAARHPESPLLAGLEYLRRKEDGTPAAGSFDGWPETAAEITVMDPCCGSGHFLTTAADLLARIRAEEEGLSKAEAADAVLRDNLFGLELDARCTQIAAFSLALWAWKRGGYRELPVPNVACSGIPAGGRPEEWMSLARGDYRLENALRRLHSLFRDAPDLGSLIDPSRVSEGRAFARTGTTEMDVAGIEEVEALLEKALGRERNGDDPASAIFGEAARGIARAASLLRRRYTLVATNVPYLASGKQGALLWNYLDKHYPMGKADLATAFVQRCTDYCAPGGSYALVTPQNWLFLGTYKYLRRRLLKTQNWNLLARLGSGAFETISGEVVKPILLAATNTALAVGNQLVTLDVSSSNTTTGKHFALLNDTLNTMEQVGQLENMDARVSVTEVKAQTLLVAYADSYIGFQNGDTPRFVSLFWEFDCGDDYIWRRIQLTHHRTSEYIGRHGMLRWENGSGPLMESAQIKGTSAWNKAGIAMRLMGELPATLYTGDFYDQSCAVLIPKNVDHLLAIWAYCSSHEFNTQVRNIDQSLKVTNHTLVKIPFDLERWQKVADEQYPDGLPEPYSDDPTQWLFHGHPARAEAGTALQVAVARLLGYRWPAESDEEMELSEEARAWISRSSDLDPFTDPDGIACLPPVAGERPASERVRALLAKAYGEEWSQHLLDRLLSEAGSGGKDLHTWLRDDIFKQHCRLFHNRPFIWHVWDGRKDGFSALVNYHNLDAALLRRLIYTYLGSWIEAQQAAASAGERGADLRLVAARDLQERLEATLEGEPPYDIYVRWKKKHDQPIGWEPDLNDGVRLNIRPFVTAELLRSKFTINWKKDRGKNPDGSERHNDLHLSRAEKEEARKVAGEA
ncbi:MAG: BREX-1 system adenine-specific DNA-methyltransferase PglX [Actinomycetota bacterium]|nr:BREX-1 system adenine-specific DNA-methyltransferase PglX [Actinomycetota bacterium]